jgi:ABC-type cobalamin/Fe3+-siderophores transport system ATPase subunit
LSDDGSKYGFTYQCFSSAWIGYISSTAFVSIVLFGMIRDPLNVIPEAYMSYIDAKVSLTRISDFLSEDERGSDRKGAKMLSPSLSNSQRARCGFDEGTFQWHSHLKDNNKSNHDNGHTKTIDAPVKGDKEPTENDPLLPINRNREDATSYSSSSSTLTATTYHGTNSFILDLPTLTFPSGKLTVIFGSTGSGKSSMLNALLGEMDAVTGRAWLPSNFNWNKIVTTDKFALDSVDSSLYKYKVAYAAQQPWIQHASIRDNIVFGQPFDEVRYNKVLYQCALVKDLDILEDGDLTEIGEKGINLSGGQKQRVSLARAVYSRAKTVLLDDCLSAVDANTASHLYEKCLLGDLMHDRTIILVSHHVRLCLGGAAYLVQMNRGHVVRHGNVEDLRNNGELAQIFGDDDVPDHITEFVKNDDEAGFNDQDSAKSYAGSDVLRAVPKKLIEEEVRQIGKVKVKIYATYLLACGGLLFWGTLICFYVISRLFNIAENYWLKVWSAAYDKHSCTNVTASVASLGQVVIPQLSMAATKKASTVVLYGQLFDKECSDEPVSVNYYICIYVWICFGAIIISLLRSLIQYYGSLRASRLIFHKLLISVCHAPMRFFGKLYKDFGGGNDRMLFEVEKEKEKRVVAKPVHSKQILLRWDES